ncbi:MAG: glycoside hydrolase family 32 protein [Actinomycetota bacterium]
MSTSHAPPGADRPLLHFTPPSGWLNDPNGLVRHRGLYHLYFQHNPDSTDWGNLHWGHAVSRDLVRWEHRPIAMAPDEHGLIFSGTTVADDRGTSGFGAGSLVAVFTHDDGGRQRQSLAHSDDGDTWSKFDGNPVLSPPAGIRNFRDPKVRRHDGDDGSWWTMVLAVETELWFFTSADLRSWTRSATFRPVLPHRDPILEVPDLFVLRDETGEDRWVAMVCAIPTREGGPEARVFWAVGDFDGVVFSPLDPTEPWRALDDGVALYAAMAWDRADGADAVAIAWLDERLDTTGIQRPWRGRMSVPRRLDLRRFGGRPRLVQQPVLPDGETERCTTRPGERAPTFAAGRCAAIAVELGVDQRRSVELRLHDPETALTTTIRVQGDVVAIERPSERAPATSRSALDPSSDERTLLVVVDHGSLEVFCDGGASQSFVGWEGTSPIEVEVTNIGATPVRTEVRRWTADRL